MYDDSIFALGTSGIKQYTRLRTSQRKKLILKVKPGRLSHTLRHVTYRASQNFRNGQAIMASSCFDYVYLPAIILFMEILTQLLSLRKIKIRLFDKPF